MQAFTLGSGCFFGGAEGRWDGEIAGDFHMQIGAAVPLHCDCSRRASPRGQDTVRRARRGRQETWELGLAPPRVGHRQGCSNSRRGDESAASTRIILPTGD